MNALTLTLNGKKIQAKPGETILDAAKREGIYIPTLCHEKRLEPFGSCRVCLVKVEGAKAFVPSCSTKVTEGMVVGTESPEIAEARYLSLSLLISEHYGDCVSPCSVKCPAHIDIQGYIALVYAGDYKAAVKLIKEKNPLPLCIGRVCPHPCETVCRRKGVEDPIAINNLKRFAADRDIGAAQAYIPDMKPRNGTKVAVIGSGPAGLSAAYYLARDGYDVTIFEKLSKAGGMLRYGIPEYRLPKAILDKEVGLILMMGVQIRYNSALGKDFSIEDLKREGFRAAFLGLGAWKSIALRIEGEGSPNVWSGIEFLYDVVSGNNMVSGKSFDFRGKTVMVVGGGNTAMDAARTSVRLGASKVMILYRRTKQEMPANEIEIEEAEEEGVVFEYLAAPIRVSAVPPASALEVECIRMELGKPDESGRRRPVPIEDSNYRLPADIVITAVGQGPDVSCIENRALVTPRETVKTARESGTTADDFVFAGGDCVTGAATAIDAVAAGRNAAESIDLFLRTGVKRERPAFEFNISKGSIEEMAAEFFSHYEKTPRIVMPAMKPEQRVKGFQEIEKGLGEEQARNESARCLECGCAEGFSCALRDNSTRFAVKTEDFTVKKQISREWYNDIDRRQPITRDESKCIKCGICVRICDEVWGLHIYGFVLRGSDTQVQPSFGRPLAETECDFCGQCADACPTGALSLDTYLPKPGPFKVEKREGICLLCSLGCSVEYNLHGGELVKVTSSPCIGENEGNLCVRGRFGYGYLTRANRILEYRAFENGGGASITRETLVTRATAIESSVKLLKNARKAAFVTSAQLSNDELEAVHALASSLPGTRVYHLAHDFGEGLNDGVNGGVPIAGKSQLFERLLGGISTPSLEDLGKSSAILLFSISPGRHYPILEMHVRRAAQRGVKLYIVNDKPIRLGDHADGVFRVKDALPGEPGAKEFLDLLARLIEKKPGGKGTRDKGPGTGGSKTGGLKAAVALLSRMGVKPEKVKALVESLAGPGKVLFIADENTAGAEALESFIRLAKSRGDRAELLLMGRGMNARGRAFKGTKSRGPGPFGADGRPMGETDGWSFSGELLAASDAIVLYKTPRLSGLPAVPVLHVGFKPFTRYEGSALFIPSSSLLETGGSTTIYNGKRVDISPILRNDINLNNLEFLSSVIRGLDNVQ